MMKNKSNKNKDLHEDVIEEDNISIHPFAGFCISYNESASNASAEIAEFYNNWNHYNAQSIHSEIHLSNLDEHFLRTEKDIEFLIRKVKFDIANSEYVKQTFSKAFNIVIPDIEFSDMKNKIISKSVERLLRNDFSSYSDKIDSKTHEILSNYQVFLKLKRELLFVHLLDVFEDSEKGERWLHEPNGALDNQSPIDFTNDLEGIEKVDKILGRIEHGIFS